MEETTQEISQLLEKKLPPKEILISTLIIFVLTHRTPYSGIGACMAEAIFLGTIYLWSQKNSRPLNTQAWISGIFAFVYSCMDVITTSSLSNNLNQAYFWIANILFLGLGFGIPLVQKHPVVLIKDVVGTLFRGLSPSKINVFIQSPPPEKFRPYTKGLGMAIPILCVFFALFSHADAHFSKQSVSFIQSLTGDSAFELLYGLLIFVGMLCGMLTITESLFGESLYFEKNTPQDPSIQQESNIILSLVNVLFGTFLFSQTQYLFGGESYRYEQNLNYSDYAVAGFYELMVVVGLVIFMSITLRFFHQEKIGLTSKVLYTALLSQSLVILISAFNRMSLYIDVYGYTQSRIFGMVFIVMAGVGLLLSLHNIVKEESQHKLIQRLLLLGGVAGLVFGLMQPDLNSARWNLKKETDLSSQAFFHMQNNNDVGTVLAILENDPRASSLFRAYSYCTSDPRSFQINRYELCLLLQ